MAERMIAHFGADIMHIIEDSRPARGPRTSTDFLQIRTAAEVGTLTPCRKIISSLIAFCSAHAGAPCGRVACDRLRGP